MRRNNETPLYIQGSLFAECERTKFEVVAEKHEIKVHVDHWVDLRYLYKLKTVSLPEERQLGLHLHRLLTQWGLTLLIVHEGKSLAQMGAEATPGLLGRWFGFPGLQISLLNFLRLLKDRSFGTRGADNR